jgi:molybdopterin converting factor small subunit
MPIRVEFYGIARERAGCSVVELVRARATLSQVLEEIGSRLPAFGRECVESDRLAGTLTANLDGERFISDPMTPIREGQTVLILSADAGG